LYFVFAKLTTDAILSAVIVNYIFANFVQIYWETLIHKKRQREEETNKQTETPRRDQDQQRKVKLLTL